MMDTITATDSTEVRLPTILCVDDESNILASLRRLFRTQGFQVRVRRGK